MTDKLNNWLRPMLAEYYRLNVKYLSIPDEQKKNNKFWDEVFRDIEAFSNKYITEEDHFAARLAADLMNHIDDMSRGAQPYCHGWCKTTELFQAMLETMNELRKGANDV